MTIHQIQTHINKHHLVRISQMSLLLLSLMFASPASAQITIGGNVYGGGNKGAMTSTDADASNVTVKAGTITGKVFGGARQAGIAGGTHVKLDGENASTDIIISEVYGGNDVSGTVSGAALVESTYKADNTNRIYVTNLYGGGNGDYDYTSDQVQKKDVNGNVVVDGENKPVMEANEFKDLTSPDIASTSINIQSGCYNQVFAGGNSATVTGTASITLNNSSTALDAAGAATTYQFDRVFGGNNKVAMAIRPTWHLTKASINNLYSGGNAGDMTHSNGILLAVAGTDMTINNVYGGCRMADVNPAQNKITSETIEGVAFPSGYAARTLITGGKINNVYGGNDVSGDVYGGCALEIQSSILNDVYGGGNGSYKYANKAEWQASNPSEKDYFYTGDLFSHRPNAESVYLHVIGTETTPTYIGGSLYCGGNSATLTGSSDQSAQLKIGSYVIADKVFLGSNGENMVTADMLAAMNERNTFNLKESADFEAYMKGVEVGIKPTVSFDSDYKDYSTKFGSLYCGGNVGSMSSDEQFTISFLNSLVIYDKIVGGCNNANVAKTTNNAFHLGGLTKKMTTDVAKVVLNISGVKLEPRYLEKKTNDDGTTTFSLKWNQNADITGALKGANVYGGCYASGYVNGDVQINVTADAISENVFSTTGEDQSGANYVTMRDNPLVSTMSVYGGGYGKETEIWGDVAVNVTNNAHILKVYGGGELGYVGKMTRNDDGVQSTTVATAYGTTVTLSATAPSATEGFAALNAAKIYGGGFQGDVTGNTHVDLNQGRVYNAFGGACNADIFGAAEIFVGKTTVPEVTNNIYGANDFGGQIKGSLSHSAQYASARYQTVRSNAYLEYYDAKITGNVFGGPCGSYNYTIYNSKYDTKPTLLDEITELKGSSFAANSFVNVIATNYKNKVTRIFGAGQGLAGSMGNADMHSSYVLLHSPSASSTQLAENIYGAGDCSMTENSLVDAYTGVFGTIFGGCRGVSLAETVHQTNASTLTYMGDNSEVDLWEGMTNRQMDIYGGGAYSGTKVSKVVLNGGYAKDVYGASYNQGITYMATVDVPSTSKAHVNAIFGGAKGEEDTYSCDAYNTFVNYNSSSATVETAIYGGNNAHRLTRNSYVNINVPVKDQEGELIDVYGAGFGENTVAEYTNVNLNDGAQVKNVFGGGRDGKVYDVTSMAKFFETDYFASLTEYLKDKETADYSAWCSGKTNPVTNEAYIALNTTPSGLNNTQVDISTGALVTVNAYGGGYGSSATVSGATGLDLLGGTVTADVYGGGYGGNVAAITGVTTSPSTNVNIQGGKARNVYGGGYEGHVVGETNTTLGTRDQDSPTFADGLPTVERSLYGGGEKGHVEGTANLTINNGYVGYKYDGAAHFVENIDYKTSKDSLLVENGNAFGGGYGEGAYVDSIKVTMYGGTIRNGLYGGGEIAAVGRGEAKLGADGTPNGKFTFSLGGETHIYMYGGHVVGDIFGGGRGFSYDLTGNEIVGKTLYSDGYVFGTTDVNIYGGEIGTEANVADGHGNVFGGGNIGYVYSVNGTKYTGTTNDSNTNGYYYKKNGDSFTSELTEDCHVLISPYAKVKEAVTVNGKDYAVNEYVPTEQLNYLRGKDSEDKSTWEKLDYVTGVTVRNAVFAGGNVSAGSDKVYANAKTVFGNATATLYDVYHRDLITIGTEHTGGLYGDGNLTFVDGYRELNITNYGTDYYGQSDNITIEEYHALNDRERAYFELKYKCITSVTIGATKYEEGNSVTAEEYNDFTDEQKACWVEAGFCSIYAGRLLNTLQRADFVGVFGSRMVLQGAQDRVPSVVDYTNYTINRVSEVSLNKVTSVNALDTGSDKTHGNYFGIYNIVNYLGALTSDVNFKDVRTTDNTNEEYRTDANGKPYGGNVENATSSTYASYLDWKEANAYKRKRNNGSCHNKVALASGVYLELVDHLATAGEKDSQNPSLVYKEGDKVYGPVTGVLELDLINVMKGLGGGYVYAKNIHGTPSGSLSTKTTLAKYNKDAVTSYGFSYDQSACKEFETSGNFIHNTKQIVDDCYPGSLKYDGTDGSAAHYWYIKGEIYVYDQYLSAYTGSATAYKQDIKIPLTITAGSHGQIQLTNIKPHMYAYYFTNSGDNKIKLGSSAEAESVVVGDVTYKLNDVITYWDYMLLTDDQKQLFVPETYVSVAECTVDGTTYPSGTVMLPSDYTTLVSSIAEDADGNHIVHNVGTDKDVDVSEIFHLSNALTHDNGYAVTLGMTNPMVYDTWYSPQSGAEKINTKTYTGQDGYLAGPTYTPKTSGVYGQHSYDVGDIITGTIWKGYKTLKDNNQAPTENQATVEVAYVATEDVEYTYGGVDKTAQAGVGIPQTEYNNLSSDLKTKFATAYVCTSTLELATKDDSGNEQYDYIFYGDLIPTSRYTELITKNSEYAQNFDNAYYCSAAGLYGGDYYTAGYNYRALDAWCSLSSDDRKNFDYRYDALDLISEDYTDDMTKYQTPYCEKQNIDYTATYRGESTMSYTNAANETIKVNPNDKLTRDAYEAIPNEQYHWANVSVDNVSKTYHIVKVQFTRGDVAYLVGETIEDETYSNLNDDQKCNVEDVTFEKTGNYYYCRESYALNEHGEGVDIVDYKGNSITKGNVVPVGTIITGGSNKTGDPSNMLSDTENVYSTLPNKQLNFTIHGDSPEETTTLYVSRESDINDLSKDRVITVIYTYNYEESDDSQTHIEQISERHIINVHLQFKSGVPTIGQLQTPATVLPSSTVGLKLPSVTPGAYEILGGGWEYYKNQTDAEAHKNGRAYVNNATPMYWYQDGWYAAYYTKTYLGKTYSNAVPFSIANYHDMDKVMADTQHHMYIDNAGVKRAPKIYIDNRECTSDAEKNELDMLYDLFVATNAKENNFNKDGQIDGCENLDFILRSDIAPKKNKDNWTSIGNDANCFGGNFHGQGYTISGLDKSLFGTLCGNVYNIGVTGSFTTAGVADKGKGYVENAWISTTGTPDGSVQAVFGNPSDDTNASRVQLKNCYYPNTKKYLTTGSHGVAKAMPEKSFYNGEVAYDLNGFYLNKRYSDKKVTTGTDYSSWTINADDNTQLDLHTNKYATTDYRYPETGDLYDQLNYVERFYADGDFVYAAGTIPSEDNERWYLDKSKYYPIYPDDYIYFGQMLTYGYVDGDNYTYQQNPSRIYKQDNLRLYTTDRSNRVFRTPAYFMSKDMGIAHFNYKAVFANNSTEATGSKEAYPNMTAIDFTANGDKDYMSGWNDACFYPPYLDYDGLKSYQSDGLTQNLLVYANKVNDADSHTILADYLYEPAIVQGTYGTVDKAETSNVHGHLVDLSGDGYRASRNHLLVDKQNFNAPIAYKFATDQYMWYQRTPELFADGVKGWETICLPFTADLVATHQKGEITHFYGASKDNAIGHEYWLRGLKSVKTVSDETTAAFVRPMTGSSDAGYDSRYEHIDNTVNNSFLWDYYYSKNSNDDKNQDDYQNYWNSERTYSDYPLYTAKVPYLISFPGENFYEYDMSGKFVAQNTYQAIAQLDKQTVSFISKANQEIAVSDDEARTTTVDSYNFRGFYQAGNFNAEEYYALDATGAEFDKGTAAGKAVPFRAYFRTTNANAKAQTILIGEDASYIDSPESALADGTIQTYGQHRMLHIISHLDSDIMLPVYTMQGQLVQMVDLKAGAHEQLSLAGGIYIVHGQKVSVTK